MKGNFLLGLQTGSDKRMSYLSDTHYLLQPWAKTKKNFDSFCLELPPFLHSNILTLGDVINFKFAYYFMAMYIT